MLIPALDKHLLVVEPAKSAAPPKAAAEEN